MVGKIKVNLIDETHSVGRGVGFYAQFLKEALSHLPSVELTRKNPDIVHYPYFDLFYPTLPFIKKIPSIVTIHDLIPLVFPKLYPKGIRAMMALFWQRIALGNVSAIVTDSLASKRDIVKLFNVNPKKVFVTPLSVDPVFQEEPTPKQIAHVKAKYDLPEKFVLYVGGINPNKNLVRLAEVAEKMNLPVVFIGSE
ncbi:MAG: mannosyltransferase B-like protein, partial [Candidatus Peregrinibacteria bacterium GW2011_GWA2_54_9]